MKRGWSDINDLINEIEKYGLNVEQYENCLKDCYNKQSKVVDLDWLDIVNKYGLNIHYDTLRKAQQTIFGGAFVAEYFKNKYSTQNNDDKYLKELQIQKDELYKIKRQIYDQRREYNKLLVSDARAEHLTEELIAVAKQLNKEKPLQFDKYIIDYSDRESIICFADWHYGMVTDNIFNTYNTEICRQRVELLVAKAKKHLQLYKPRVLHVLLLGDSAHGAIHTGVRVASEEDTCDQLMHVAELMAEAINELANEVEYTKVYSTYGNHLRTIQNKNDSIHSDNMEKIVPWWMKQRFQNREDIEIVYAEFKEFIKLNVLGYNIVCTHGDLDKFKDLGVTVNTIFSKLYGVAIDYTISADKHHLEEFEQFGIESILVRSLAGTDDYANDHRLYSKAGQSMFIFNKEEGREATLNIKLN